jgi:hypothetical protein
MIKIFLKTVFYFSLTFNKCKSIDSRAYKESVLQDINRLWCVTVTAVSMSVLKKKLKGDQLIRTLIDSYLHEVAPRREGHDHTSKSKQTLYNSKILNT